MLNRTRFFLPLICWAGFSFALAGCSGGKASVSGTVTLDGEPLKLGTVCFHPVNQGPVAYGEIDSSGKYSLTVGSGEQLTPGDYVVTVVATEPPIPPKNPLNAPAPGKLITPPKYGDKKTTDLKSAISAGSNTVDLQLKSK